MARSWQYPRWRRIFVQAILCLILAAALAIAALVSRQRIQSQQINFSRRVTVGSLTVLLPSNWLIQTNDKGLMIVASEHPAIEQGPFLMIQLVPVLSSMTAAEFLAKNAPSSPSIPSATPSDADQDIPPDPQPIEIASSPGILKYELNTTGFPVLDDYTIRDLLIAAAILPNHQAIYIRFACPPDSDEENTTLIQKIAATITLSK